MDTDSIKIYNLRFDKPDVSNEYDIVVDRKSVLGNPFRMYSEADRNAVCDRYSAYFKSKLAGDARFAGELNRLRGIYEKHGMLNLFCWCFPKRCHAQVIKDFILKQPVTLKKGQ